MRGKGRACDKLTKHEDSRSREGNPFQANRNAILQQDRILDAAEKQVFAHTSLMMDPPLPDSSEPLRTSDDDLSSRISTVLSQTSSHKISEDALKSVPAMSSSSIDGRAGKKKVCRIM